MKLKKYIFISLLILFFVILILTVIFYNKKNNEEIHYEVINCTVLSTDRELKRFMGHIYFKTSVFVFYDGVKYKLIGAENKYYSYTYPPNKVAEVYLSNNKLYADENAIRNDLKITKVYFAFLFLSGIVGIFLLISMIYYIKEIKKLRK